LIGKQPRLAGQMFFPGIEVGGVEGTDKAKTVLAADDDSQNHG